MNCLLSPVSRFLKVCFLFVGVGIASMLFISPVFALQRVNSEVVNVLGQPSVNEVAGYKDGMTSPNGLVFAGGRIYVADHIDNRIGVYNSPPTHNHQSFDFVLDQPGFYPTYNASGVSAASVAAPYYIFFDGVHFYISDAGNNRILVYNHPPSYTNQPADWVIGQSNFNSNTPNNGGLSASSISSPRGVWSDGTKLIVVDAGNNRVLIWNSYPQNGQTPADVVLGQPDFVSSTANNGGRSAHSLSNPRGLTVYNGKLYIVDQGNNRILVYNSIPETNQFDAYLVIGQPDMASGTANNGGITAHSLNGPNNISFSDGKMIVSDLSNNRVLIWNTIPEAIQADASVVIGQGDMATNTANRMTVSYELRKPTAASLWNPYNATVLDGKLYIADTGNARVLVYNSMPQSNGASADIVLGQSGFRESINHSAADIRYYVSPSMEIYADKLYIAEYGGRRIIGFPTVPLINEIPSFALGQQDIYTRVGGYDGVTSRSVMSPFNLKICNGKLLVSDVQFNRVLVWNMIPTSSGIAADVVIGQPDFGSYTANNGGVSAHSLSAPQDIACLPGGKIAIADSGNNRVLIFNAIPASNGTDADLVVGQELLTTNTANYGGLSAKSLSGPVHVETDGTKLLITDFNNNRILVFSTVPTDNYASASVVIGQPDTVSGVANNGGLSAATLYGPREVTYDRGRLYVGDSLNRRVLVWKSIPTSDFKDADLVIGQQSFSSTINSFERSKPSSMINSIRIYKDKLYVSSGVENRILVFSLIPTNISASLPVLTANPSVVMQTKATDAYEMIVSSTEDFSSANWEPYASTKAITLSESEGIKTYYVKYRDYAEYESQPVVATTILDKTAPVGSISINEGAAKTSYRVVRLNLHASDTLSSVSEMSISTNPSFEGMSWESYKTSRSFTLTSNPGQKFVFVKYRDKAGNVSKIYQASIQYEPVMSPLLPTETPVITIIPTQPLLPSVTPTLSQVRGNVTITVVNKDEGPLLKTEVKINGQKYTTDATGRIILSEVLPGVYSIEAFIKGNRVSTTLTLKEEDINKEVTVKLLTDAKYYWWWILVLIIVLGSILAIYKRKRT